MKTRQKSGFFDACLRALTALKSLGSDPISVQIRLLAPWKKRSFWALFLHFSGKNFDSPCINNRSICVNTIHVFN